MRERVRKVLVYLSKKHKPGTPYKSIFSYLAYIVEGGVFWWVKGMLRRHNLS